MTYVAQILRYDIVYSSGQLARAMSRPAKVHMGAAKHLLRYLAGTTEFTIVYKKGGFKLTAFSDSNWGKNSDNGKSTPCYIIMLSRALLSFKSGVQSLTAMSTMEGLGFGKEFEQVPLHIDNTATLHVISIRAIRFGQSTLLYLYVSSTFVSW